MAKGNGQAGGVIVAVVSDLHSNSTTGLCPPRFTLDDGGDYVSSKAQRWLWRNWLDYWQTIAALKADTGLPVAAILNGDAHDGDHHNTPQIITRNENDQLRIAVEVVQPVLDVADKIFVIRGTEAHVGKSAWREEALADDIGAVPSADGTASHWHLYADFHGVVFDIQHHPESVASRPWTAGAEANRISAMLVYEYAGSGDRVPDIAIRSHRHQFRDSGTTHKVRTFQLPPWQLATAFVNGPVAAAGKINPVGGMWFVCRDGSYTWDIVRYKPARSKPVRVIW